MTEEFIMNQNREEEGKNVKKLNFVQHFSANSKRISGYGLCFFIIMNIVINLFPPFNKIHEITSPNKHLWPKPLQFISSNLRFLLFLITLVIAVIFVISIAFQKRKNWARILFICIFLLAILAFPCSIYLGDCIIEVNWGKSLQNVPDSFASHIKMIRVMNIIIMTGVSIFFLWIIKKLTSKETKMEFRKKSK
jgi:glucan phosphoethanolaminetransferase (alkaline phosphatase superfamily)